MGIREGVKYVEGALEAAVVGSMMMMEVGWLSTFPSMHPWLLRTTSANGVHKILNKAHTHHITGKETP